MGNNASMMLISYLYGVICLYCHRLIYLYRYCVIYLLLYCMLTALEYYLLYIYILFLLLTSTSIFYDSGCRLSIIWLFTVQRYGGSVRYQTPGDALFGENFFGTPSTNVAHLGFPKNFLPNYLAF